APSRRCSAGRRAGPGAGPGSSWGWSAWTMTWPAVTPTSCPAGHSSGPLAADPPVLLMDEPFSAVDPIVRATLQDELLRLQAELHKTVVLVTHDVEEAIKVGDQVAIFRPGGRIAQLDTPERLLAAPAH